MTATTSGTIGGMPVVLQTTTDSETDSSLDFSVDLSTSGVTQDINIALVVDISGSVTNSSGSDLDGDGIADSVLKAEIIAAKSVFQDLLDAGYAANEVEITLIAYNGSAMTLGTYDMTQQSAFESALGTLAPGGQTNFGQALTEVINDWDATTKDLNLTNDVTGADTNHVIFLSDGYANGGTDFTSQMSSLENTYNASISAIGMGASSSLADLNLIDNTGGATQITNMADLSGALVEPPPPLADLTQVEVFIDGVSYGVFTPGDGVLTSTPIGFTIDTAAITGFPYHTGQFLNFDVVATFNNGESIATSQSVLMPNLTCFVTGTLVNTPAGYRRVETLVPGDRVRLAGGGSAEVRLVTRRPVSAQALASTPALRPVRIRAHAFGPGKPFQDLLLSRQHRVLIDTPAICRRFAAPEGVLAPVHALIDRVRICGEPPGEAITYYHLVLDRHEVVDTQGLPTETFHATADTVAHLPEAARTEMFRLFPRLALEIVLGNPGAMLAAPARPVLPARVTRRLSGTRDVHGPPGQHADFARDIANSMLA